MYPCLSSEKQSLGTISLTNTKPGAGDNSFCRRIAEPSLSWKECFVHRHRYQPLDPEPARSKVSNPWP